MDLQQSCHKLSLPRIVRLVRNFWKAEALIWTSVKVQECLNFVSKERFAYFSQISSFLFWLGFFFVYYCVISFGILWYLSLIYQYFFSFCLIIVFKKFPINLALLDVTQVNFWSLRLALLLQKVEILVPHLDLSALDFFAEISKLFIL